MYIVAVNDGAVMNAWKKDQGLGGSDLIEFAADTSAELTVALDLVHPNPTPNPNPNPNPGPNPNPNPNPNPDADPDPDQVLTTHPGPAGKLGAPNPSPNP